MNEFIIKEPERLSRDAALFLDFDGTLVELAATPGAIRVPAELPGLLSLLARRLGGRVAIVSGRSIEDLDRHLGPSRLAVSGSHGLELRLADGTYIPVETPEWLGPARLQIADFASSAGLLVEEKPSSLALHYRNAPEREGEVMALLSAIAERRRLVVQRGKMVAELRPPGADKGDALRRLMAEPQFASARPLFVGDDLTDEDGFAAAASMGGGGILVGQARQTAARWRLDDVRAVIGWLEASVAEPDRG